jgi:hypothetical protein
MSCYNSIIEREIGPLSVQDFLYKTVAHMPINKDNVIPSGYQTRLNVYSQWPEPR